MLAVSTRSADDTRVHLAAVDSYPEPRPVVVLFRSLPRGALQEQARARRAKGVIGLVALPEHDHELVSDDLVHLAAGALHQRDDALEVDVQHGGDLRRVVLLRVAGEPFEICEDDAHVLRSGERLVQVERR